MARLNLETLELVSSLRRAPANGAPSSHDYNDSQQETATDLGTLGGFLNDILRPILNALPDAAAQGLEGRRLYTDTTDQDTLFYDTLSNQPLTVADSVRLLNGLIKSVEGQVTDLRVEVGQLSSKLSSSGQNDIALALRNINDTLVQIQNGQRALEARVATLEA